MNLAQQLISAVEKQRKRVLIIGDGITDVWIHGESSQCQDGCPKFVEKERIITSGGAANAEQCLKHWRVRTTLYCQADVDQPVKCRWVDQDGKIVFRLDDESQVSRLDPPRLSAHYSWVMDDIAEIVPQCGAVLLSDYDKGFLWPELIRMVVGICEKYEVPCVSDAKRNPELYTGTVIKGNHAYWVRNRKLVPNFPQDKCVMTQGRYDPLTHPLGTKMVERKPAVECINQVGAGDCFAAHLTLALAYDFPLEDAAAIAHSAGRVYVQYPHNRAPYPDEIVVDMGGVG